MVSREEGDIPEFGDAFSEAVQELQTVAADSVARRRTEAELRSDLLLVLSPFVVDVLGLPPHDIRHEGTGISGRYDSMFGRAIIEYKRPNRLRTKRERASAAEQAIAYLEDTSLGASIVIITDGQTWGILRDPAVQPELGEQAWLDLGLSRSTLTADQRFAWLSLSEMSARRVLTLLSSVRAAPVDADTITDRLAPTRSEVVSLLKLLGEGVQRREKGNRTEALFNEWVKQAGVTYGIDSPGAEWPEPPSNLLGSPLDSVLGDLEYAEAIFVLHTYVGVACKLLGCEVLAIAAGAHDFRPTQWLSLSDEDFSNRVGELETGRLTEQLGAPGILSGDLFGWYVRHSGMHPDFSQALRAVIGALSELAWAEVATAGGVAVDLLRSFYQSVVPRRVRRYLGEFFTPRYLAERVLTKGLELTGKNVSALRVLDPACGSGTFLVAALRAKLADLDANGKGESPEEIAKLIDSVVGFDINPISAVMSQVNLLLALGDRADRLPSVRLNVYHADAILPPLLSEGSGHLTIQTEVADFNLPEGLADSRRLSLVTSHIAMGIQNSRSAQAFEARLRTDLSRELEHEALQDSLAGAVALYSQIVNLHASDRNGVWGRFIEHALAPQVLNRVDLVVGNPPWISWKDLPAAWKERSEATWRSWGLWHETRRGSGVPLSDISVLLTARALMSYCRPEGVVAMLLPQSVLIADPGGRPFRQCRLEPDESIGGEVPGVDFAPLHIDDFSAIKPFAPDASNLPVALYLRPHARPTFPVAAEIWTRSTKGVRLDQNAGWSATSFRLSAEVTGLEPVDKGDTGSPWGRQSDESGIPLLHDEPTTYRWGRGFETRGLDGVFFCEILTEEPFGTEQIVRIRTRPDLGSNTRDEPVRTAEVEATFLLPLMKGRDVNPWAAARPSLYCIVPYRDGRVLTVEELRERSPLLFDHLEPFIPRLLARSLYRNVADERRPWVLSGPFEHLDPSASVVMVRYIASGGRPRGAFEFPRLDRKLGRRTIVLPNNKCNIFFTHDSAEGHYLTAWMNARVASDALGRFAASTGITPKALQRLPIPKFELTNKYHRMLAAMGQRCAEETRSDISTVATMGEIDAVVAEIAWSHIREFRPGVARQRRTG